MNYLIIRVVVSLGNRVWLEGYDEHSGILVMFYFDVCAGSLDVYSLQFFLNCIFMICACFMPVSCTSVKFINGKKFISKKILMLIISERIIFNHIFE